MVYAFAGGATEYCGIRDNLLGKDMAKQPLKKVSY
jgi:hypothetical protein